MGALSLTSSRAHPRALSLSLALFRSLSISGSASLSRAFSSLFQPRPARSLACDHPVSHSPSFPFSLCLSLSLPRCSSRARRSSLLARLLSSLVRIVRHVLLSPRLSRRCFSFRTSLSSSIRITILPRSLGPRRITPASPLVPCIFAFFSLALSIPFSMLRRSLSISQLLSIFLSFLHVLPLVPSYLFRSQAFSFSNQQDRKSVV